MIPRAPSLFHLEEGVGASTSTPIMAAASGAAGELVGLRLIIQPSPRKQRPTVLRRSAVRIAAAASASSKCGHENGRMFVGLEFLKRCFCCHKNLDATMDVFVYKGEQAFCSAECRCQHMAKEERREIEMLIRKRRDAFHRRHAAAAPKMQGSNRLIMRLQTAAR
ncbi:hypothetical protein GQ55_9G588800 [Panicum hallii var. hallii]|uniref:FLZ-type domain-containing protein n=3 Tax=Panicum sect. Panicum TaxID=2100772 RepID=A0A3L6S929_PANMI|nr:uncharacterized protein LOC112876031 [Panicum hallii]PAN51232.1 hypothetical protein PAHAL_9G579800 [Panicum hallii]PUZ42518.1 hypothetical protein GQ55_9G588800 [Panicum hallii var. hallii]RLN17515.1 uncharacterized protein C2845_PM02G35420 [Panicum miliaceum]